jgi:endonuclease/exonuclease/phosphatase family metal-dependent hydrolase
MVDGFKEINPDNKQPSGCGWEPECPEEFMGDYRIDWVLHSKNLVVKRSEILVERRNGAPSSDHFPVISILNYPLLDKAP